MAAASASLASAVPPIAGAAAADRDAIPETASVIDNGAWGRSAPRLSVLTPFFRDDPIPLLARLDLEAAAGGDVELVVLDDGGGDDALATRVDATVTGLASPARFVRLAENVGRARGRNALVGASRGRHVLFLDCDMKPDSEDFLRRYLAIVAADDPPVVFGGFSMKQVNARPDQALHRALQQRAECVTADVRRNRPEKYVYTSNLLVRRDVLTGEAFDEGFKGWGWEDVEWGMRVARRYGVVQIDNPATHLGLDTAAVLAGKYEQSAGNFARVVARHPEVRTYPSYRLARLLKHAPARPIWRRLLRQTALQDKAPMPLRIAAMKIYRAALYSDVV